uniref:Uncharacterized protein n=1 Tax=Tanacetum cinerariifolium TaxID=118510 RepID=A0A6L2M2B8_TANCI|nr:hypothetical protein [Tanacetum cinerariifolium]
MVKSSSCSENEPCCSKACKKNTDSLNSKIIDLSEKLGDRENMLYHYKLRLSQVEARLVEFKNQEIKFSEKIRVLEFNINGKTNRIEYLTKELENLKNKNKESNPNDLQNSSSSASENGESTGGILSKPEIKFVRPADTPTVVKTDKVETPKKPTVKYAKQYRKPSKTSNFRGNQRNWNNLKSQQLGENFVMKNKACFNCAHFDHLSYDYSLGVKKGRKCPTNTHKSTSPRPAVYKTHRPPIRPVRPNMNGPRVTTVNRKFPTVNRKLPTVNRKFPTGNTQFSTANLGNKGKADNSQNHIDDKGYWDSGCSRHITGNISYLTNYEPFDGGYVSFGQGGCKITGKGTIKTGKLEFENVYFVKDLKTPRQHNMYTIDLNNIVPHKDLTCLVAKASADESMLWHRRLVTDDFSRFTWTFFLKTKDETSGILRNFITEIENLKELRVKIIRVLVNKSQNKTPYELFNGKFEAKGDEGYFIGYSMYSKTFRVFNKRTKRVEENLHVDFLENKPIEKGAGPNWLFDIDSLTNSYVPVVVAGTNSTNFSGTEEAAGQDVKKDVADAPKSSENPNPTATSTNPPADHMETLAVETPIPTVSSPVPTACLNDSPEPSSDTRLISKRVTIQDDTPSLDNILSLTNRFEDILRVTTNTDDTNGVEADLGNMETTITAIQRDGRTKLHVFYLKKNLSWVEAMQEELLKFKIHNVWILVDFPKGVRPIRTKWVLKNKNDERGIVIRNKARLVAQGHTQKEGIDYDKVFVPVARIEAIRLFLAYASFMGFTVYQMDVKSAFLYGTIDEEVYVMQPPEFQDPEFPARVYKVEKAMYGLHQAPRAWYGTLSKYLLTSGFQKGTIDQTLFIRRHRGDFILVQVYVDDIIFGSSNPQLCREFEALMHEKFQMSAMGDILKKFGYSDVRSANTLMEKENPWGKDGTGKDVDLHHYRSMIGSLMYLTASRPDIMFAICACARHQVTPKECHLQAVKMIFRYLKGHTNWGFGILMNIPLTW